MKKLSLISKKELRLLLTLGMNLPLKIFPIPSTGLTWMESTISHGTKTNIFLNTVDHAGPKVLPPLLLIDLTS